MPQLGFAHRQFMNFEEQLHHNWQRLGFHKRLREFNHGSLVDWLKLLNALPSIDEVRSRIGNTVVVDTVLDINANRQDSVLRAVEALIPWRKGPFDLFGINIDAEWRSDLKWLRVRDHLDLKEKNVLDVGSGNGYFGFRMLEAGATTVTGLDSSLLAVLQAALINHYTQLSNVVLPVRFGSDEWDQEYDVVFSMGVVYHQRNHEEHIRRLLDVLHNRGTLVLESIVADQPILPKKRYARMRNVWCIPSTEGLHKQLKQAGMKNVRTLDVSITTPEEQRQSRYMPFESLTQALDQENPALTVEGLPAPKRAVIIAEKTLATRTRATETQPTQ